MPSSPSCSGKKEISIGLWKRQRNWQGSICYPWWAKLTHHSSLSLPVSLLPSPKLLFWNTLKHFEISVPHLQIKPKSSCGENKTKQSIFQKWVSSHWSPTSTSVVSKLSWFKAKPSGQHFGNLLCKTHDGQEAWHLWRHEPAALRIR